MQFQQGKPNSEKTAVRFFYFIFLLVFFMSYACSPEKKLGKSFVKSGDTVHLMLMMPDDVVFLKQNLTLADDKKGKDGSDSASLAASHFLNTLEDKKITDLILANMESVLKSGPFKVYNDDELGEFMQLGIKSYMVSVAQIELDESAVPYTAYEQFDTLTYYENFSLNAIGVNLWLEVTEVNGLQDTSQILFSKMQAEDAVDGYFTKNYSGMVEYIYKRTDIDPDKIYSMAADFGEMNAHYLLDYFLNKYIHENYDGKKLLMYYHYDGNTGRLLPAGYNRFVFM
jgi:hypothetical protein